MKLTILATLAVAASSAIAQPYVPSDLDLRATYCVPVVEARIRLAVEIGTPAQAARATASIDLDRLRAYVRPKVVLSMDGPTGSLAALATATERGRADAASMGATVARCIAQCSEAHTCVSQCVEADPAAKRMQSCRSLDWLPF